MKKVSIRMVLLFILLVFLQVWLFSNIHLFGVATPLLYIYFLIKLPIGMNRNSVLFLAALMGLIIDVFNCTLGLNMFVLVLIGFFRHLLLKLFVSRDVSDTQDPSFETFGKTLFMRYAGAIVLIQSVLLFSLESFSLFDFGLLFLRIMGSFTLTLLLIFAFESISFNVFKK